MRIASKTDSGLDHPVPATPAGIDPSQAIHGELRVLIGKGAIYLAHSDERFRLLDADSGELLQEGSSIKKAALSAHNGRLRSGGLDLHKNEAEIRPALEGAALTLGGRSYRGKLVVKADGNNLLLINQVSLEQYLYGVLPSEVPESWPMEALRAQALAARTFALGRAALDRSRAYDLDDSTQSQVYLGMSKEGPRTREAVDSTRGMVVTFGNGLAETFFFSNCGGHTEASGEVFGHSQPYLTGVPDRYCRYEPHFAWKTVINHTRLQELLRRKHPGLKAFGEMHWMDRDASGRWKQVTLAGRHGEQTMKSTTFRMTAGPDLIKSTHFTWHRDGDDDIFEGQGWGHGVGMCQEGSKGMADHGSHFREIIATYFPGTKIQRLKD